MHMWKSGWWLVMRKIRMVELRWQETRSVICILSIHETALCFFCTISEILSAKVFSSWCCSLTDHIDDFCANLTIPCRSEPTTTWPRNSCTIQQLHWLPIEYRITYKKLCLIIHLVHTKRAPQYLSDSVQTVARSSSRPGLRSSNTTVYVKPRCRIKFGERGFSHAGPTAWNSLPRHLHQISDTGLFKRRLKTELFRRAYVASSC